MLFVCQVIIEGANGGQLPGAGGGREAVLGIAAVVMLGPVAAEIGKIGVNIRQRDFRNKIQIHIHNVDLIQRKVFERRITDLLEISEEIPQVQKVFVYSPFGVGFDSFMVSQKLPQDIRRISLLIDHRKEEGFRTYSKLNKIKILFNLG